MSTGLDHSETFAYTCRCGIDNLRTTEYLKALADETRLRAFRLLAESPAPLCVAETADILQKPPYAVSRSFIELRKAGLATEDRQGKFVFYSLTDDRAVQTLGQWARQYCPCQDPQTGRNADGSSAPGGPLCHYDSERLKWRLSLREPSKAPVTHSSEKQAADQRPRVLFVCVHNSARSQLAEEYLRKFAGEQFLVESAGLVPGTLNPQVVEVLKTDGIDIAQKKTQAVGDLYRRGETYQWVVTVCSREAEENCPVFPGPVRRLSWPFPDPSRFTGTPDQIKHQVEALAEQIQAQVRAFIEERKREEES